MENATIIGSKEDCRIYLVDDDFADREFFSEALGEVGQNIHLTPFSGGKDVLIKLGSVERLPDIIFLDLYMPGMDGKECLAKIRADQRLDSVCVVLYSTLMDLGLIEELFNEGANRYLKKPWTYGALKNALEKAIESIKNNPLGGQSVFNYSE